MLRMLCTHYSKPTHKNSLQKDNRYGLTDTILIPGKKEYLTASILKETKYDFCCYYNILR